MRGATGKYNLGRRDNGCLYVQQPASVLLNRLFARARFRHLQVLVRLAELGSVRRTAEAIGMTQPGVTQLLGDLEGLLGTPLFQRHARGVRPTPAGADLLPLARQMLVAMAATAEAAARRQDLGQGVVRVGATTAVLNGLLVSALPAFNARHPAIQLHLVEGVVEDLLLAVGRGELDLVACRQRSVVPEGWAFHVLAPDRCVVVAAADHPLAAKRSVSLAELAKAAWLPAPAGSIAREQFDALCLRFDREPALCNISTRIPSVTWALLHRRQLLTLVPLGVVGHLVAAGQLAVLKVREAMPLEPLGMLVPLQDVAPATAQLADFLTTFSKPRTPDGRR